MKVILQRDVKGMGRAYEVIEAKDGYALNYLIPQKIAVAATLQAIKESEARKAKAGARKELDASLLAQNIASLAGAHIVIKMKANEKGHLYDAVGEADIARAVKESERITLPEGAIRLEKPIKDLGTFTIPISVGKTFGSFPVTVEAE